MTRLSDRSVDRIRAQLITPAIVADRYRLIESIGRGGMGEVFRAHDTHLERDVALKVLAAEASPGALAERLRRESRVLALLEHPGIVPVYDAGELADGRVYYVMRFVQGERLDAFARAGRSRGELLRIVMRIADSVAFAHGRGVIHRDLKPGNVMIGPFGEVLVLDWGVAKVLSLPDPPATARSHAAGPSREPLTEDGAAVGTPGYMSPEQASGTGVVDERADVFALGVILRELVAVHADRVPRPLASLIAKATAPAMAERYATVTALSDDLRRCLDGERVAAHREGLVEHAWRFARRHQVAILLLATYAVVRTVILLWRGI